MTFKYWRENNCDSTTVCRYDYVAKPALSRITLTISTLIYLL